MDRTYFNPGLRLLKVFPYGGSCDSASLNQVGCRRERITTASADGGHCKGLAGHLRDAGAGDVVYYRWPCLTSDGSQRYAAHDRVDVRAFTFMTLPSRTTPSMSWAVVYSPGKWHHADRLSTQRQASFPVLAVAAGKVIFSGGLVVGQYDRLSATMWAACTMPSARSTCT